MYFGCDLSIEEYAKDFEKLGYTHEESMELAKAAIQPITINPAINWDEIVEAFNNILTVNPISAEYLKKTLEKTTGENAV